MLKIILLAISFIALIGIRFIPNKGKLRHIWLPLCLANLLITGIFMIQAFKKDQKITKLETDIHTVMEYADVAELELDGRPFQGRGIEINSDLSKMLEGTYVKIDNRTQFKSDEQTIAKLRLVIEKYPKFPFAYYGLAYGLSKSGNPEWKIHAERAYEILRQTTKISSHKPCHDEILMELARVLEKEDN